MKLNLNTLYGKSVRELMDEGYQITVESTDNLVVPEASDFPWREEDGVIYFTVTSDGATGEDWIARLKAKGIVVTEYAKRLLRSSAFKPTNGVSTEIAVLKGMLWNDTDRSTNAIRAEAEKRGLEKPNAEVACLIREKFTDKEHKAMGLWRIVAMHEPVDVDSIPRLLGAGRDDGGRYLLAYRGFPDDLWYRDSGFAFVASQVSS